MSWRIGPADLSEFDGQACAGISSLVSLEDAQRAFLAKVVRRDGCWGWLGRLDANGYARLGRNLWAHRVSYVLLVAPIPDGHHIDHVRARGCVSRSCTNPAHLEAVTQAENARRVPRPPRLTHCIWGHDKRGKRECPVCMIARRAEWHERQVAKCLSSRDVQEICSLIRAGVSQGSIGERFGVHQTTVSYIKLRWIDRREVAA